MENILLLKLTLKNMSNCSHKTDTFNFPADVRSAFRVVIFIFVLPFLPFVRLAFLRVCVCCACAYAFALLLFILIPYTDPRRSHYIVVNKHGAFPSAVANDGDFCS